MENKIFKSMFGEVAKQFGFEYNFGGWFKESEECIIVLELQKSNYSNLYYLNLKIFIQGVFNNKYKINKELVKKETGDVFLRPPESYRNLFDLDIYQADELRKKQIDELFSEFINPFTQKALTKEGIIDMYRNEQLFILPAVKKQLGIEDKIG